MINFDANEKTSGPQVFRFSMSCEPQVFLISSRLFSFRMLHALFTACCITQNAVSRRGLMMSHYNSESIGDTNLNRNVGHAQRDGRPAEYRWRPLFNAAKFGWRSLLDCRAVTLPKCETGWNLLWCPKLTKRSQPLVGRSLPYCEDMWRTYRCLTSFFSDCRYVPSLRRYSLTKLWDGAQMATFWRFFASCISASRAPRSRFQTCILNLH